MEGTRLLTDYSIVIRAIWLKLRLTFSTDEVEKQSCEEENGLDREEMGGANARQKRKRKDKRAPKDRRKKQKKESTKVEKEG